MSVIVRFPDGKICVICKGADSAIMERLRVPQAVADDIAGPQSRYQYRDDIEKCMQSVEKFAKESFRTLLCAYRFIAQGDYVRWIRVWKTDVPSLLDQEKMIESAGELIEVDLGLAGATAIEDKLQLGVPESIDKLSRAGIKIWMLTGDKGETAINIGQSCGLIKEHSTIIILRDEDGSGDLEQTIRSRISTIGAASHGVLVIDGTTLARIYSHTPGVLDAFFSLTICHCNDPRSPYRHRHRRQGRSPGFP